MDRSIHGDRPHQDIAVTLTNLGALYEEEGNLKAARQYYEESLHMNRSIHGDRPHQEIAATLHQHGGLTNNSFITENFLSSY